MITLLLLGTALATGIRFDEVPCPHGEGTVRKFYKVSANTMGGYDSDLAVYSTRGQFREHAISTCPSSYFSALGSDLNREIPETLRSSVDAAIELSRTEWADRDNPKVWERYDAAARISSALGRDSLETAELYLNASWTVRDAAVGVYVGGLNGPQAAREILRLGTQELAKELTPDDIKLLRYNLARVAHRGGFSTERDSHLSAYLQLTNLSAAELEAGRNMRRLTQTIEPRYQRAAILSLKDALARADRGAATAQARYQLADLQRRLGNSASASKNFKAALAHPDCPNELKAMAAFLLEEIGK